MRFKTFLENETEFNIEQFMKDCSYFISLSGGKPLFHGSRNIPASFEKVHFRPRKMPRDNNLVVHNAANDLFDKNFDHPFRNGLFCTGSYNQARTYGKVAVIFPIGKFEWLSSPDLHDLYFKYDSTKGELYRSSKDITWAEITDRATKQTIDEINKARWINNTDFLECLNSKNEIMLWCDKYYEVNYDSDVYVDISRQLTDE